MTDLTPNDLSHLSDAEFHALCPQGEHAPGAKPLSPAAQAVLDGMYEVNLDFGEENAKLAIAALRALADAIVPLYTCGTTATRAQTRLGIRHKILSIAIELENHD